MGFLEKIQTLHTKLSEIEQKINEYNENHNSVKQIKNEIDIKNQEIEKLKIELESKYNEIAAKLPATATKEQEGLVTLSDVATLHTDENKAITANILQHVLANIISYIPVATTEQIGLVKLAKAEDVNSANNNVISISTLDELKQPVDISNFRQKGVTTQGLNYFVDVYNKEYKTLTLFGMLDIEKERNRIELPVNIKKETTSIVITPINTTAIVYPTIIENRYIDLFVEKSVLVSIQIICCLDPVPEITKVKSTLKNGIVEISLQGEQ